MTIARSLLDSAERRATARDVVDALSKALRRRPRCDRRAAADEPGAVNARRPSSASSARRGAARATLLNIVAGFETPTPAR
jgi:hypothetical protein